MDSPQPVHEKTPKDRAETPQLERGLKRNFDSNDDFSTQFSKRVNNVSIADLLFVEVFSGTAGLTAAVRRLGFQHSTAVDATSPSR